MSYIVVISVCLMKCIEYLPPIYRSIFYKNSPKNSPKKTVPKNSHKKQSQKYIKLKNFFPNEKTAIKQATTKAIHQNVLLLYTRNFRSHPTSHRTHLSLRTLHGRQDQFLDIQTPSLHNDPSHTINPPPPLVQISLQHPFCNRLY